MLVNFDGQSFYVVCFKNRAGDIEIQLMDAEGPYLRATVSKHLHCHLVQTNLVAIKDYSTTSGVTEVLQTAGVVGPAVGWLRGDHIRIALCPLLVEPNQ